MLYPFLYVAYMFTYWYIHIYICTCNILLYRKYATDFREHYPWNLSLFFISVLSELNFGHKRREILMLNVFTYVHVPPGVCGNTELMYVIITHIRMHIIDLVHKWVEMIQIAFVKYAVRVFLILNHNWFHSSACTKYLFWTCVYL